MGQLVVGAAAYDARGERVHHVLVQRPAQRARGQDVQFLRDQRLDVGDRADFGVAGADGVDRGGADIAYDHLGPGLDEVVDETVPDLAYTLDADGPALQAGAAPGMLGRRSHSVHDA